MKTNDILKEEKTMTATSLKNEIKELWQETFDVTPRWLDMYFDSKYRDEDVMTLSAGDDDDVIASALLLQRYSFYFHSTPLPMGYVSGAVTRREYRDRGYMKQLMREAIEYAYERGDALVALIPEERSLYGYYERQGFSTLFYIDEERYTDRHKFEYTGTYEAVDPRGNREVFKAMDAMLRARDNVVLHGYDDFQAILADVSLDGGHTVALRDTDTGKIAAIALAAISSEDRERVTVRELLALDEDARLAALAHVSNLYPGHAITVIAPPDTRHIPVHARAMARLVNARKLLSAYAARYPRLTRRIKLYDPVLPDNSHIYIIDRGEVVVNDGFGGEIDLDVTPEILLSILCSDRVIGEIFELPTARPYISMMLD